MKVLIVEDNPSMRRMIHRMVAGVADEISECDDGVTACSRCCASSPRVGRGGCALAAGTASKPVVSSAQDTLSFEIGGILK